MTHVYVSFRDDKQKRFLNVLHENTFDSRYFVQLRYRKLLVR